jgi:hypothetical protein
MELRYPITLKASASIYALAFAEQDHRLRTSKVIILCISRSAGVGLRVFMPAFGLLGIDLVTVLMHCQDKQKLTDGKPILDNNFKKLILNFLTYCYEKTILYLFYR